MFHFELFEYPLILLICSRAFAKIDIPKDTVITLYSGFNLNPIELALYNNRSTEELLANNISNADPAWSVPTKYHGSVKECGFTITIPPSDGPLDKYRATLGHKLNHSFKPNCEYGGILDSPRFGLVRAFYTNRDIKKDEELFIAYGYPVETGPLWYRELYNKSVARGEMDALTGLTSFLKNKEKQPSN